MNVKVWQDKLLSKTRAQHSSSETENDPAQTQPSEQVAPLSSAERRRAAVRPYPRERYTGRGGPPNFPFGETPYQQAFQSFRMEEDLKDGQCLLYSRPIKHTNISAVEEFRRPDPPAGVFNALKRKLASTEPPADQFALPQIPTEWSPTNVPLLEKRLDLIEKAKRTEGLPDTDEAYFTPAAIAQMERDKARVQARNERRKARAEIVKGAEDAI